MKIDLHIDRLTLQGADPSATPEEVAAAIEAELARLSEIHGLPFDPRRGGVDLAKVSLELEPGASGSEIGVRIARQLVTTWYRSAGSLAPDLADGAERAAPAPRTWGPGTPETPDEA